MAHRVKLSAQTLAVLQAMAAEPSNWRHGYDLARETGLKSGSFYPILVRLADRELVEARWEEVQRVGRPRRHLYRLTPGGLAAAAAALAPERRARAAAVHVPARLTGESS